MAIASFLPGTSLSSLRIALPKYEIQNAADWGHLRQLVAHPGVIAAIIDPSVDGTCDVQSAKKTIRISAKPVFAYVRPSFENLKAVFTLSQSGLVDVFLANEDRKAHLIERALEVASHNGLSNSILGLVEARLINVSLPLRLVLMSLFDRPQLYGSTAEIAKKAGTPVRQVYREVARAGLGTPKKLLTASRVVHAYASINGSQINAARVSHDLRLLDPRHLREMIDCVFSCSLEGLRKSAPEDVLLCVVEWLYRPARSAHGSEALE
jgi:hypothetical protein